MAMISIDTDAINSIVPAAENANTSLAEGLSNLRMVVEHDDWGCRERDVINQRVTEAKDSAEKLVLQTEEYLAGLRKVSMVFNQFEDKMAKTFSKLETTLAGALSIKTVPTGGNACTTAKEVLDSRYKNSYIGDPMMNYEYNNMTDSIKICKFDEVRFTD